MLDSNTSHQTTQLFKWSLNIGMAYSLYSLWISTKYYMWLESGCNRWNDFNREINYLSDTHWLICVHLGNVYIALWFDQNWKNIFKNNDKLWINDHWFCIITTSNKIVHYSGIYTANMSRISFRNFDLFTSKSVKCFFSTYSSLYDSAYFLQSVFASDENRLQAFCSRVVKTDLWSEI